MNSHLTMTDILHVSLNDSYGHGSFCDSHSKFEHLVANHSMFDIHRGFVLVPCVQA